MAAYMFVISAKIDSVYRNGVFSFVVDEARVSPDVVLLAEKCASHGIFCPDDVEYQESREFQDLMKRLGQSESWNTFSSVCFQAFASRQYTDDLVVMPACIPCPVSRIFHIHVRYA